MYSEDAQIVVNNFLSEEIPAGKYYVLVEDHGYSEESCIKIEAKPTTATIPDYDGLVYDTPLTVGNPEFGTLSMLDDPFTYNNEEDWAGYADAFKVELTPGFYRVAGSVTGAAGEYKDAGLFMFSQITGDYGADLINQSMNGGINSKVTSEFEFVVDSVCTYYIYLSNYGDASVVDYELVVEKVKGFTELTIPCRINGTIAPGSELYNEMMMGDLTTDGFYSVYIPQDTILKFKASVTNESGNPVVVAFDKGDRMPVIGLQIENNETRFLILNAGWWSMAVLNVNSLENVTYDIAISYGNLEAVTDTITLMDLLNNAPLVEQVANDSVYLGYKPSSFVEDIAGKMRYAIAYKLQLDSAESVVVTRTPSFDDQLFIYRSKGDSVELIDKVDGEEPYLLTADSTCAYYVVFSSWSSEEMGFVDEISMQPFVANSYSLAEVIGMAKDITLPYHEEGTLGDVLCSDLNTYVKCYRVKLDSAAVLRFIVENVSLLYDAWPAMYIYAQDTTLVFDDSRSLLDMHYMADSTAYYYLVVTTDYEFSPGGFVFDAQLTESRTLEQQLTGATLLEGKGTRTDNLYYMPEVNAMCRFYKMELDSSQMVYFEPLSGNLTVFKAIGDTIVDVPLYNDYYFAADSTTTYYVGIVTNGQNSMQFTYAITPKALPVHDVEGMHFILSDALNFEQSAFIWNSAPFLSTDKYRFSLSKDEHALLLQNDGDHANLSYVLLNGTPIGSNFTTPYQSPKDSVYEVQVITPMGNNNVPFNMLLQRAEAHDSVLNRAPSIEMNQFPYSASETRKQNFEQKRLVYYQNKMYNFYTAFKVDMKLGDQLRFEVPVGSGAIAADYVVFKQGTSGYTRVANSQFADIYSRTFSAPASATYYIMIKASGEVGKGVFDKMDDVLAFTVSNPNAVTEVVRIEADCKMVQATDYTSDISVRMALAEVQLTAITKNGASVGITNASSGWTVNGDVTMATYSATLPTGYAFTADAETEVTVWVNPGVVNVTVGEHGSVTPTDTVVLRGESVTLDVKAHTGFVVHTVKVNDADYAVNFIGKSGGNFTLLADDVLNVEVMFRAISALDKVETPQAAVYARDSRLVIEGADKGSTIQVYTLMGTLMYTTQATSSVHEFELPTAGLYIVRVGTQVTKVMRR